MLIESPPVGPAELGALGVIRDLEERIAERTAASAGWQICLRRLTAARAVRSSCSIDGTASPLDEVLTAAGGHEPIEIEPGTRAVVQGCWDATVYTARVVIDESTVSELLLRSTHFLLERTERGGRPGHYRTAASPVRLLHPGSLPYQGATARSVPSLVKELVAGLAVNDLPMPICACMAHLNLVLVRPFQRGNGRAARLLHALLLARSHSVPPVFALIDEHLARSATGYREALALVGGTEWNPGVDASPWVRFTLNAHYQQCRTTLWRLAEADLLWEAVSGLASNYGLPPRVSAPVCDAVHGVRLRNPLYRDSVAESGGGEIEFHTASRDLRALVSAGLLQSRGATRARSYVPSRILLRLGEEVRHSLTRPEMVELFGEGSSAAGQGR